eukprot:gene7166-11478_t
MSFEQLLVSFYFYDKNNSVPLLIILVQSIQGPLPKKIELKVMQTTTNEEKFQISVEQWNFKIDKRINNENQKEFNNFQINHLANLLENQNQILRNSNIKEYIKSYPESIKLIENIISLKNLLKNEQILKLILNSIFLIITPWKKQNDFEFEKYSLNWSLKQLKSIISISKISHHQISFSVIPLKTKNRKLFLEISEMLIIEQSELQDENLSKDFITIIFDDKLFNELSLDNQQKLLSTNFNNFFIFFEKIVLKRLKNRFGDLRIHQNLFVKIFKTSNHVWKFVWNYLIDLYLKTKNDIILSLLIELFQFLDFKNLKNYFSFEEIRVLDSLLELKNEKNIENFIKKLKNLNQLNDEKFIFLNLMFPEILTQCLIISFKNEINSILTKYISFIYNVKDVQIQSFLNNLNNFTESTWISKNISFEICFIFNFVQQKDIIDIHQSDSLTLFFDKLQIIQKILKNLPDYEESFNELEKYYNKIKILKQTENEFYSIVLVGTKSDLEDEKVIKQEQVKSLTELWNCVAIETSSKLRINIEESFVLGIREYKKKVNEKKTNEKKECLVIFVIYFGYYFVLTNYIFEEKFSIVLTLFTIFVFENVYLMGLTFFSTSFSIGELFILAQGLTIACIEAFVMFFGDEFVLKNFPKFSLEQNFIIYMITGVVVFSFLQHFILKLGLGFFKPFLFFTFLILYLFSFQFPAMQKIMKIHPLEWIIKHLISDPIYIKLCILWTFCIIILVILMNLTKEGENGKGPQTLSSMNVKFMGITIPKIIIRKGFHIITFMFIPGTILSYRFMYLAYGFAICVFIFIECIRIEFKDYSFGQKLNNTYRRFTDERDGGILILTHSYLLFGCAIPLWMDNRPSFTSLLGIIVLGMGDTCASIFGVNYGTIKWPSSTKSIQGTLGAFFSMLLMGVFLSNFVQVELFPFIASTFLVSLLEAFTEQIDNLCLPIYYVAVYQAFLH